MSVLVTGGAGYIGSHTVRLLRQRDVPVVVLDTLEYGRREALLGAPFVQGDVGDRDLVAKLCAEHDVDACIHFAAFKNVGESMADPGRYFHNNVEGTVQLLEGLRTAGVDRFVFSSSCSVYGTPADVPVDESAPIHPESVYAETKAMVERLLHWYGEVHGLRSVSLRYFNAAGASSDGAIGEDWTVTLNLVPVVMKATLGLRPPVQVFGTDYPTPDGTCIRDYIHVEDLAEVHLRSVEYLGTGGRSTALNVGTGVGSSVLEVIRTTEEVSGRTVPAEMVERRAGDPVRVYADTTRVADVLGWRPRHGLREIIDSAWRWHAGRSHGDPSA